ncbi:MAG: hypothetical protein KDI30_13570, partial [Pseudomonadales bacterium]|nr:hypothetical protein [Pseudomonadales bacterium]
MKHRFPMAALTLALFANFAYAAGELVVEPGKVYTVTKQQQDLELDRLVLGDGARLAFDEGVSYWNLIAGEASIGQNVVIDGGGRDGQPGIDAAPVVPEQAESCSRGEKGNTGGSGGDGGDAV